MVLLNRAVAVAMVHGPGEGLRLIAEIDATGLLRDHHRLPPVEEVEHPVLPPPGLGPQLVDPVAEVVRGRPPELVALLGEQLKPRPALDLRLLRQAVEPVQERSATILIAEEDDRGHRHGNKNSLATLLSSFKVLAGRPG